MSLGKSGRQKLFPCLFLILALAFHVPSSAQDALLWFEHGRPTSQAIQATEFLAFADSDGLIPADYDAEPLRRALNQARYGPVLPQTALISLDTALTAAMERYLLDLHQGRLDPRVIHQDFKAPAQPPYFDAGTYLYDAVASGRLSEAVYLAAPRILLYAQLRRVLADYRRLSGHPAWNTDLPPIPGKKLESGQTYDGIAILTHRLIALGDLPANIPIPDRYEGALVHGVQTFQ